MEETNSLSNVLNEKWSTSIVFQCTRELPYTPSWGDWKVCMCTHNVNVSGWQALEITQGFGQTKSTSIGFYGRGIYGILNYGYITQYSPQIATNINVDHIWIDWIEIFIGLNVWIEHMDWTMYTI